MISEIIPHRDDVEREARMHNEGKVESWISFEKLLQKRNSLNDSQAIDVGVLAEEHLGPMPPSLNGQNLSNEQS